MGDAVQTALERIVPTLLDAKRLSLFDDKEIKQIIQKRRDFEFKVQSASRSEADFVKYAHWEVALEDLRRTRCSAQELKYAVACTSSTISHIHGIMARATSLWPQKISLWDEWAEICSHFGSTKMLLRSVMMRALAYHPCHASFWLTAARVQVQQGQIEAPRRLLQLALRHCPNDVSLWVEYLRFETHLVVLRHRRLSRQHAGNASEIPPKSSGGSDSDTGAATTQHEKQIENSGSHEVPEEQVRLEQKLHRESAEAFSLPPFPSTTISVRPLVIILEYAMSVLQGSKKSLLSRAARADDNLSLVKPPESSVGEFMTHVVTILAELLHAGFSNEVDGFEGLCEVIQSHLVEFAKSGVPFLNCIVWKLGKLSYANSDLSAANVKLEESLNTLFDSLQPCKIDNPRSCISVRDIYVYFGALDFLAVCSNICSGEGVNLPHLIAFNSTLGIRNWISRHLVPNHAAAAAALVINPKHPKKSEKFSDLVSREMKLELQRHSRGLDDLLNPISRMAKREVGLVNAVLNANLPKILPHPFGLDVAGASTEVGVEMLDVDLLCKLVSEYLVQRFLPSLVAMVLPPIFLADIFEWTWYVLGELNKGKQPVGVMRKDFLKALDAALRSHEGFKNRIKETVISLGGKSWNLSDSAKADFEVLLDKEVLLKLEKEEMSPLYQYLVDGVKGKLALAAVKIYSVCSNDENLSSDMDTLEEALGYFGVALVEAHDNCLPGRYIAMVANGISTLFGATHAPQPAGLVASLCKVAQLREDNCGDRKKRRKVAGKLYCHRTSYSTPAVAVACDFASSFLGWFTEFARKCITDDLMMYLYPALRRIASVLPVDWSEFWRTASSPIFLMNFSPTIRPQVTLSAAQFYLEFAVRNPDPCLNGAVISCMNQILAVLAELEGNSRYTNLLAAAIAALCYINAEWPALKMNEFLRDWLPRIPSKMNPRGLSVRITKWQQTPPELSTVVAMLTSSCSD